MAGQSIAIWITFGDLTLFLIPQLQATLRRRSTFPIQLTVMQRTLSQLNLQLLRQLEYRGGQLESADRLTV